MTSRRVQKARLETIMGVVAFFALMAFVAAVANALRPDPQPAPALVAAALIGLEWWIWRQWRKG